MPVPEDALETAVGVFAERTSAEAAVRDLEAAGFRDDELGFLTPGPGSDPRDDFGKKVVGTTAAAAGGGAVAGGILAALAAGVIPGVGPVIGGGVVAALVGAATAGAGGMVSAALFGSAASEDPRTNYSEFLKAGRTLVTVTSRVGQPADRAREILARHGAEFPALPRLVNPPRPT